MSSNEALLNVLECFVCSRDDQDVTTHKSNVMRLHLWRLTRKERASKTTTLRLYLTADRVRAAGLPNTVPSASRTAATMV